MNPLRAGLAVFAAVVFSPIVLGAASAGTIRGSFDRAPFYHGRLKSEVRPVGHVRVRWNGEREALDPDPTRSLALAALLDSLCDDLDGVGITRPLPVDPALAGAPDVNFGARRGGMGSDGKILAPDEIDTKDRRMVFDVEGPSKRWREEAARVAGDSIETVLVVQLGFGEYWVRQKDWKGNKRIELGSGRALEVPWLTSLDDPVQVLQLTGALVTTSGRVLRVGAEALTARRTGMGASMLGAQEILTEADFAALNASSEGTQPVWRAALRTLVLNLLSDKQR